MSNKIGATKTLFNDTFNGPLSNAKWDYNHWKAKDNPSFYGRTQVRQSLPDAGDGVARLKFDTYNPRDEDHKTYLGAEMITRKSFGPAKKGAGIAFEVKAKFEDVPKGLVGGIFPFSGNAASHNEIDWELLSNDLVAGRNRAITNVYADEPIGKGHDTFVPIPSPLDEYHVYRMEWLPNQVRWLVDGKVVRVETDHVPTKAMALHINFWTPGKGWKDAFSDSLKPAASEGASKSYYFDAAYAKVFELSTAYGTAQSNVLKGTKKADWIEGGGGDDAIRGRASGDTLFGDAGDDTIHGGKGADTIHGREGNDLLTGGLGADGFVFDRPLGPDNIDTITDFTPGRDSIQLDDAIFTAIGAVGALAVEAFALGAVALEADDRILYDAGTGDLAYDEDGTGPVAPVIFATLTPGLALGAGDFIVT
jgi:beta-glucanase (GH16 family)